MCDENIINLCAPYIENIRRNRPELVQGPEQPWISWIQACPLGKKLSHFVAQGQFFFFQFDK